MTYCLCDDQKHLLASLANDWGEMVRTSVINIHIPNRTRRKKVGGRKMLGNLFFSRQKMRFVHIHFVLIMQCSQAGRI